MFGKYDKEGNVICQECGKAVKKLNGLHLKSHNMTLAEYVNKYKNFPISGVNLGAIEENDEVTIIIRGPDSVQRWLTTTVKDFFTGKIKDCLEEIFKEKEKEKGKNKIVDRGIEIDINSFITYKKPLYDSKDTILKFIKLRIHDLESNYTIENKTLDGYTLFRYVVDMAIISKKIAIDFPDMFWHNPQIVPNIWKKKQDLKSIGWRLIEIKGRADDKNKVYETIKNYLKSLS